jgi:hypothetical protein
MSAEPSDLASLTGELPPGLAGKLRAAHDATGFLCAAHDNGQECCLDYLLGPAAVAVRAGLATAESSVPGPGENED